MTPDRRTFLRALGAGSIGTAAIATNAVTATTTDVRTRASDGPAFDLDDGFASTDWFDDDAQVITVTETTRSAVESAFTASGPRVSSSRRADHRPRRGDAENHE